MPTTGSEASAHRWVRWPTALDAHTWRRTLYMLAAVPTSLTALALLALGRVRRAARLQRAAARGMLGVRLDPGAPASSGRTLGHALVGLPTGAVSLAVAAYGWSLVPMNVLYPVRLMVFQDGLDTDLSGAWGGPELAGAWAVHAWGGFGFLLVMPLVVRGVTAVQGGLARWMLAGR